VLSRAGVDWGQPLDPGVLGARWGRACKRAGVDCHLHALRHFAVSAWLEAGVPLALASRQAGHARQSTTANIYSHVLERRQVDRSTAAAVEAVVDLAPR
jgi:integrase